MRNAQKRKDLDLGRAAVSYIPRRYRRACYSSSIRKKKRQRLKNVLGSVGAEAAVARRPLNGKLKVERL